jgi:hypothetical protein
MNRDEEFEKWFEEYFCNTQTDDSPYTYNDVKIAFYKGYSTKNLSKKEVLKVLNEEVYKRESRKGMVGWTIPSFHQFIETARISDDVKNYLKTQCTSFLHRHGMRVDVANYHDRCIKRLQLE